MDTFGPDFKHVCINTLRYADDTTLMADSEEKLKRLLMKVKVVSEKAGLKRDIKKKKNFPRIRVFSNELALHIRGQCIGVSASTSVLPMNTQD